MQGLDDLDREIVAYWAAQYRELLRLPGRALLDAATHAVLARLRSYTRRSDLLAWHDLSSDSALALIRSLLPCGPEPVVWLVWCAALHLRWMELDAVPPSPRGDREQPTDR
jgi:hypothetical protein